MFSSLINLLFLSSYASASLVSLESTDDKLEKRGMSTTECAGAALITAGVALCVYGAIKRDIDDTVGAITLATDDWLTAYGSTAEGASEMVAFRGDVFQVVDGIEVRVLATGTEAPEDVVSALHARLNVINGIEDSDGKVTAQSILSNVIGKTEALVNASKELVEVKRSDPAVMACGVALVAAGCYLITK